MARKKNSGVGSVYYNKERKNWIASITIHDIEMQKQKSDWKNAKNKSRY